MTRTHTQAYTRSYEAKPSQKVTHQKAKKPGPLSLLVVWSNALIGWGSDTNLLQTAHFQSCTAAKSSLMDWTLSWDRARNFVGVGIGQCSSSWKMQCTMQLYFSKNGNRRFKADFHHSSHFLLVWLFETNYLEIGLCPVSLLIYIWGLVEHSQLPKKDLQ